MNSWLEDKTILITGATSGIGLELARRLECVKLKRLLLLSWDSCGYFGQIAEELKVNTPQIMMVSVNNTKGMIKAFREVKKINVLVHSIGSCCKYDLFKNLLHDDIENILTTNLTGSLHLLKEVMPKIVDGSRKINSLKKGHVVLLSSRSGERALPRLCPYTASKGGIEKVAQTLQMEYAKDGISFTLINPGSIKTNFTRSWNGRAKANHNEESMTIKEAVEPILFVLHAETFFNKISYESGLQWRNEPGVLL